MWIAVAVGGTLGALARWGIGEAITVGLSSPSFPWGTLVVNVLGCAAIGFLAPLVIRRAAWIAGFVATGFLGVFTTYSAFAEETFALADRGDVAGLVLAGIYVLLTIGATSIAVVIGSRLAGQKPQENRA